MNLLIPEVTIEECAEVIQAIVKYQRFGPWRKGYDNKLSLENEVGQLYYMLDALVVDLGLDYGVIHEAKCAKYHALRAFAEHNVCNQTQPEPTAT
jgi:NTP pyrophosphatase (non-canonical NTP hydrolase)